MINRKIVIVCLVFIAIKLNAQNTTFNNVAIGLNDPDWGVNIKTNFPGYTGDWFRGFFVSNETGGQHLLSFFAQGESVNGVSSLRSSSIGKDFNEPYMTFLPNANVGIGTTNPRSKIQINKAGQTINTTTPSGALLITDDISTSRGLELGVDTGNAISYIQARDITVNSAYNLAINPSGGNVGIGTVLPDSRLTVKGKIHAEEVKIDLAVPADYVFEKYYLGQSSLKSDYNLLTLSEVEKFTKENHHLPNVPSAKEIKENGVQLGEMSNVLLQKIEELTLYVIEMKKENEEMKGEILKLKQLNK